MKAGRPKIVTKKALEEASQDGKTIQELAKELHCSPSTVYRAQSKIGINLPSNATLPVGSRAVAITARMCRILADGEHLCQNVIAKQFRVSRAYIGQIAQAIRNHGWKI